MPALGRRRLRLQCCSIPKSIWARLFIAIALLEVFAIICIESYVIKRTANIYKYGTESQWGFGMQNESSKITITQQSFI
ncbi:hypothetical protein H4R19_006389, partial [Coemansia spiralis]